MKSVGRPIGWRPASSVEKYSRCFPVRIPLWKRVGDIFIATTRDGAATVFKSSDNFGFIAKNNLDDGGGNATPTVVDHKLLIRTDHSLFCIGTKQQPLLLITNHGMIEG